MITYSECGHTHLSTTPEHTRLCYFATDRHLVQGIDRAPPPCVPTDDLELPVIAQNTIIGHCDDCRVAFPEELDLYRGGLQDVVQLHAHADVKYGDYDEMEMSEMKGLKDHLKERNAQAQVVEDEFETLRALNPDALAYIKNDSLRAHLAQDGPEKYNDLYRKGLRECEDMLKALQTFIDQNVEYDIFVKTYTWIVEKTKRAFAVLENFQIITNCLLKYNASRLETPLDGHGARLDLAVDVMMRILQRKGPDSPPDDREFYKPDVQLPAETVAQIEEAEAAFQTRLVQPMTPSKQTNFRRARGDMHKNALNKNGLGFEPKSLGSLLNGEKANEIKYEHLSFPDPYHLSGSTAQLHPLGLENRIQSGMGIDVEDEHGNKLVWDDQGVSHVIFATTSSKPVEVTNEPIPRSDLVAIPQVPIVPQAPTTMRPKPTEGFGFGDSSDDDPDDFEDDVSDTANGNVDGEENDADKQIVQGDWDASDGQTPQDKHGLTAAVTVTPNTSSPPFLSIAAGPLAPFTPTPPSYPRAHQAPLPATSSFSSSRKCSSPSLSIAGGPLASSTPTSPSTPRPFPAHQASSPTPSSSSSSSSRKRKTPSEETPAKHTGNNIKEHDTILKHKRQKSQSPRGKSVKHSMTPSPESLTSSKPAASDSAPKPEQAPQRGRSSRVVVLPRQSESKQG